MTVVRGVGPIGTVPGFFGRQAFLRLWSYPNTFIDKRSGNKGVGKEITDLLIVFGDDILIFSDKSIGFPPCDDVDLAWSRWYRRAVVKSADQVRGAERWLAEFSDRIFLDPLCTQPFPIELPPLGRRRVHGIVVAQGANEAAKRYFSDPRGTLAVIPGLKGSDHTNKDAEGCWPFSIGDVNPSGSFIHVFDPVALDLLLDELDTVADFTDYLRKREAFIRSGRLAVASGEEDLLAIFLQNGNLSGARSFIPDDLPARVANHRVIIQPGEYECFIAQPEYGRKQAADAISYVWDRLIENFIEHALAGTSAEILDTPPEFRLSESALRIMAAETRFRRRKLGQGISEAMKLAEAQKMALFVRNIVPTEDSAYRDIGYVFLILAFPGNNALPGGYAEYREVRTSLLQIYCLNLFDMHPELETVVGIAIDASERVTGHPGGSEDLIAFPRPEWTDKLRAQFEDAQQAYGLKPRSELQTQAIRQYEFPLEGAPFASRQQRRAVERRAAKQVRLAWALIRPRR